MFDKENPKPGVYSISNADYHSSKGISRSQLKLLDKSPLHFWHRVYSGEFEDKDTPAKRIGNAFHSLLLEPFLFEKEYAVKPQLEKLPPKVIMKEVGKEQYEQVKQARIDVKAQNDLLIADFEKNSQNKIVLSESEFDQVFDMVQKARQHEIVNSLLKGAVFEQSIYWIDKQTGLLFKARPDAWVNNLIIDVKTIFADAVSYKIQRAALDHGYFLQAGMMYEACKSINKPFDTFVMLFVEKEPPYAPAVFMLNDDAIQFGLDQFQHYKEILANCINNNEWNTYPVQELSVPAYITKRLENEL